MAVIQNRSIEQDIQEIYRLTEDQGWEQLLTFLIQATNSNSGALILVYVEDSTLVEADLQGIDQKLLPEYVATYAQLDPWTERFNDMARATSSFVSSDEIMPLEEYMQSRFYQGWGHKAKMMHGCGSYFSLKRGQAFKLAFQRDGEKGPYLDEVHYLNALRPHLERAIEIASLLRRQSIHESVLSETLSALGLAAFWCDFKLDIKASNSLAKQMLSNEDLFTCVEGRLNCQHLALAELCQRHRLVRLGEASVEPTNSVTSATGEHFDIIVDTRLNGLVDQAIGVNAQHEPGYLIMVRQHNLITANAVLSKLALTQAEAQAIALLCNGDTLADIANKLGKSQSTIKSQFKSASSRLGAKSQHEIVAKVLRALL